MKYVSGLPLTERERKECAESKRRAIYQDLPRRRAVHSLKFYAKPGNARSKRLSDRLMGESEKAS